MNRVTTAFANRKAFIVYITAGDPTLDDTARLLPAIAAAGADIIEVGVPFSDPSADGPVIQRAAERALASGTTLRGVLDMLRRTRAQISVPILLFTYMNPIVAIGIDAFASAASAAGVDAVLVVDLPPEEAADLDAASAARALSRVYLVAPTTPPARIRRIARASTGFIYFVSMTGITGANLGGLEPVERGVAQIRKVSLLPVAVGFGVATPDEAARVAKTADGVVVGSAIVRALAEDATRGLSLVRSLASAVHRAPSK
ncbi:MAG: tryptophan synthase subunit alpha [Deltaproteobacteria bacterium]|nr:tryptophan synthase subunit alpha [Deltaproteobacteria bacterium]